jgi:uncharacterized heparinase superfamily protein
VTEDDAPEIPVGRRLVRLGGDKGLSLGERLSAQFYRLSWRSPLHALRLRGRFPLKLLAVPTDPLPGDRAAGAALCGDGIAFADLPATAHRFGFLRDLAVLESRAQAIQAAEGLMRQWLAAHGDTVAEPAWRADNCGWRILHWAAHAPLILSSTDLVYRSSVLNTLARTARHIDRTADRAPLGNARVAAWAGIVAAGLLIPGGDVRRNFGEAGLARAMAAGFSEDGGVVSRSPTDQIEAIELIALLAAAYDARNEALPEFIETLRTRAVAALLGIAMGDGALSSWQGAGPIAASAVQRVVAASGVRTRPLRQARDWGYQRMAAGGTVVVVDVAPPPASRLAGIGCASTLAFELSDGDQRLIVNCGNGAALPPELAQGLRTTAAHSTLTVGERNSTAILDDGSLGQGVGAVELDRQEMEGGSRLDAAHDGYAKRLGFLHKRTLALSSNGRELRGEDALLPAPRRKRNASAPFAIRFHLAPGVEVTPTADGHAALLRIDHGPLWQFRCRGGTLSIEESLWIDAGGRARASTQFVVSGTATAGGASVGWLLKRAG